MPGQGTLPGDLVLQQFRGLPGAARGTSASGARAEGEAGLRAHPERLRPGGRPDRGGDPRELPAGRRLGSDPGSAQALPGRNGHDHPVKIEAFPQDIQPHLIPSHPGRMIYRCLGCDATFGIERLLYVCPQCRSVLMLEDAHFDQIQRRPGELWRRIFDYRKMLTVPALKGIYRYHEFIGPVIPLEAVVYLGEGHTPLVARQRADARRGRRRFLFQERRPEPERLLQGPRHGERLELPQHARPPGRPLGGSGRLRLHRRHLGRRGALRVLPEAAGQIGRPAAPRQSDPPAAVPAARQRRHRASRSRGCSTTA